MKLLGLTIITAAIASYCEGMDSIYPLNDCYTGDAVFVCDTGLVEIECSGIHVINHEYFIVKKGQIELLEPSLHYKLSSYTGKKEEICQKLGML